LFTVKLFQSAEMTAYFVISSCHAVPCQQLLRRRMYNVVNLS